MEKITACTLDCPDACSLLVSPAAGGELVVRGNPRHPVTAGFTCRKIKAFARRLSRPDRIRHPMLRRRDGGWDRIGWDDALDRCARILDRLRDRPGSVLHVQGSGAKGVVKAAVRVFFHALGATGTHGDLCDSTGFEACLRDFGSRENHDLEDFRHAGSIVNWGKDLVRTSVHLAAAVRRARRRGARLLTISPGGDGGSDRSDVHLRICPGSDRFLAAAAIRRLIETGRTAPGLAERCRDWPGFSKMVEALCFEDLTRACAVSAADVDALLQWYGGPEATATIVGTGLQRYRRGGENVRYINALALVSGNVGRPGSGVCYHLDSLKNFDLSWIAAAASTSLRTISLPFIGRDIALTCNPPIEMAWVNGCNIVNQAPDSGRVARALERIPFTVVADAFMTDTARCADLVLPAALMLEQEDLVGSFLHDYIHYAPAVVDPPGEARDDLSMVRELGRRLARPIEVPDATTCMEKALASPHLGLSLDELRVCGFTRARRPKVPYADGRFDHPDGRYRFPQGLHRGADPSPGYPLRLMTWVRGDAIHSQMAPEGQLMPPQVWIAPECPAWSALDPALPVALESPLGRMAVRLEELPGLYPEVVLYRRGDWAALGGGANRLVEALDTDMGAGAAYYEQGVRLINGR